MEVTEGKVSEEQGEIQEGKRMCRSDIIDLGKDKKLYAAFMDLEKAYDRVDRGSLECAENLCCGWTSIKGDSGFL